MTQPVAQGSIRRRLLILLLVGAAIFSVLLYFIVQSVARQVAQESQDNILAASALSVMDSARSVEGEITVDLPYSALSMLDSVTHERVFYAIWLGQEHLTGYADLPRPQSNDVNKPSFLSDIFLGEEVRIAAVRRPFSTDTGHAFLEVSVAQTLAGQREKLTRISRMSLGIGAGFFVLCAVAALIVARSTIRPLDRLTASVSRRGPKDLRPVAAPVPQEMVPLVASLNRFMLRLQSSLNRSEDFIAEAAHRVRTPLATVRAQAEVTHLKLRKPEHKQAIREMIRAIDESARSAGQMLDHAMVTFRADSLLREELVLNAVVEETCDRLDPTADLKDIVIHRNLPDHAVSFQGDRILLQAAVMNILDNAIKYSPADSDITVSVVEGAETSIAVTDEGRGFADTDLSRLVSRYKRGANVGDVVGSGLGLTIAADVAQVHGGRLSISSNKEGPGACVSLLLPR